MDEKTWAVARMQKYIEMHLPEEISLEALGREAMYSPWYAHRLFTLFTHQTPADYVRRLRLSKSALLLRDEGCRITDAAFACGFKSVDGYQRAFFREFHINPNEYARRPTPLPLFTPYSVTPVKAKEERKMMDLSTVTTKLVEKPARKVLIRRGIKASEYWEYCQEIGCDIWGLLVSMKSLCGEPVCLWLPEKYRTEGTSEYVQGVEKGMDEAFDIPEGFDVISLPASRYLEFHSEPFKDEDFEEAIETVWEKIKHFDPAEIGCEWNDENPRIQLEPRGERGYIELLPIK